MKKDYGKIKGYYDQYGSWYDKERRTGYYELINELEIDYIAPHVKNRDVLEVGCGTGIILNEICKVAREATGIDLSSGMLEDSRRKGLNVIQANVLSMPFEEGAFDAVYSCKVLPHVPEIVEALKEIRRVLRPGGTALLEFYNPFSIKGLTNWIYNLVKRRNVYIRYDSIGKVRKYVQQAGGRVVDYRGIRIATPFAAVAKSPALFKFFKRFDGALADGPCKFFGSYLLVKIVF